MARLDTLFRQRKTRSVSRKIKDLTTPPPIVEEIVVKPVFQDNVKPKARKKRSREVVQKRIDDFVPTRPRKATRTASIKPIESATGWPLLRATELIFMAQDERVNLIEFQSIFPVADIVTAVKQVTERHPELIARLKPSLDRSGCDICCPSIECASCSCISQLATICSECGTAFPYDTSCPYTFAQVEASALRCLDAFRKIMMDPRQNKEFDTHGGDALFLFRYIATHSLPDSAVQIRAREVLLEVMGKWEERHPSLAADSHANNFLVFAEAAHAKHGLSDTTPTHWVRQLRETMATFSLSELLTLVPKKLGKGNAPMLPRGVCSHCGRKNNVSATECIKCKRVMSRMIDYESTCFAIVWAGLFRDMGLELGGFDSKCSVSDVLELMPRLRPYGGIDAIGEQAFKAQGYFITHLIFVMSSWGAFRLEPEVFAEELAFLSSQLNTVIRLGDPELVGEFVQCLRLLGLSDEDFAVQRGVRYLLGREKSLKSKGEWVKPTRKFFQKYHAMYCALIGILPLEIDPDTSRLPENWRQYFV